MAVHTNVFGLICSSPDPFVGTSLCLCCGPRGLHGRRRWRGNAPGGVWSLACRTCSGGCGSWSVSRTLRAVRCGLRLAAVARGHLDRGAWAVGGGLWATLWTAACGLCTVDCGLRPVGCGVGTVTRALWTVSGGWGTVGCGLRTDPMVFRLLRVRHAIEQDRTQRYLRIWVLLPQVL